MQVLLVVLLQVLENSVCNFSYARIKIHLTNEGPNSLCDYNEVIIIERLITEKTTNFSIKTRSFTGAREEVKEKIAAKHHIEMILQQFNIELDNPLSWLSQDRSRQFLQSMKPDRLYEVGIIFTAIHAFPMFSLL